MIRLLAVIAAVLLGVSAAHAQQSKAGLDTTITTNLPDNTAGAITPAIMRSTLEAMVASYQQYAAVNAQTGTSYSVVTTDYGQLLTFANGSPVAVSLASASAGGYNPFSFYVLNNGSGTVTITPSGSTIGGSASLSLGNKQSAFIVSDGANWQAVTSSTGGGGGGSPGGSNNSIQFNCTGSFCGTNVQNNGVLTTSNAFVPQVTTVLPNGITATTQATADASQLLATDQFVQNVVAGGVGQVSSVFGRTGIIVAQTGDYNATQVTNALNANNNLSDVTSAATSRTNLGLGTLAIANAASPPALGTSVPGAATFSTLAANTSFTSSTTANFLGIFQFGGNTIGFPNTAATLAYQAGSWVPGDCLQVASSGAGGPVGAIADAGAACGSGGGGGGSSAFNQTFVANSGYTPFVSTTLTLSSLPASQAALTIYEDGVAQPAPSAWTVNLTSGVVTFTQPILAQHDVYATWFSTSLTGGTVTSVSLNSGNGFAGSVSNPTTTPGISITTSVNGYVQGNGTALSVASGAANTMLGNWTSGSANIVANAMPSCADSTGNHLNYVSGTGVTCGTSTSGITALTGDVTASGAGSVAATIAANAVTYAKFQTVAAHSLVGNPTGSGANAEGITLGATLGFSGTTLNCTTATAATGTDLLGCVIPDGTSIAVSAGVISVIGSPATAVVVGGGATTVTNGTPGDCLYVATGPVLGQQSCGTATSVAQGSTTVTSASGSNQLLTTGTVSGGTGTLTNVASITLAQTAAFTRTMNTLAAASLAGPMGFVIGAL